MKTRKKIIGIAAFAFAAALSLGTIAFQTNATEVVADAETATFAMQGGAQVRTDNPAGIRFVTDANAAYKAQLAERYSTDTYTYVWGTELTFTDAAGDAQTIDAETKKWLDDESGWYTALVDIPASDYLTEITAQSYVKIYNGSELVETKTASNPQKRSIAYSASWALNSGLYDADILYKYTKAIPDTSLTLDKEGVEYVDLGTEIQLTATAQPAGYGIAWRSSDTNVATVDKNGKVTTKGAGLATITATLGNSSDSYQVAVDYTNIDFEDGKVSPAIGSELTVLATNDSNSVPVGTTFDMTVADNDYTALTSEDSNKAYGTAGLESVANASITLDWDWLNYVFSKDNATAVSIDIYTNKSFGWWKLNNGSMRQAACVSTGTENADTTQQVRQLRLTFAKQDFATLTQNQDVEIAFRYVNGLQFVYVDNLTWVPPSPESLLVTAFSKTSAGADQVLTPNNVVGDKTDVYGISKITSNNSATMYATLSSEYLGYLFADSNVTAITFDMMISINNKVVKINNQAIDKTITADETGYIYHITITRTMYESYPTGTDIQMCYLQGDRGNDNKFQSSTFFYVDNLAVVK